MLGSVPGSMQPRKPRESSKTKSEAPGRGAVGAAWPAAKQHVQRLERGSGRPRRSALPPPVYTSLRGERVLNPGCLSVSAPQPAL
ncbi:hypothetical protein NDU88_002393 [Pleurodeles waltl]|uniref:Uncharacterized protein n=1 Tax=Pleurodeles waltl TaxID=8319 RepID=A0AAV7UVG6_PLEWA|nr:hypothetical protein NDU88_002393 [Pleurodeles waltl]